MARTLHGVAFSLVLLALLSAGGLAAAAESHCKMTEEGLIACLPSMTGASPAKPSPKCCAALGKADLACLCKYEDSPALPQLGINRTFALQLPAKCKLSLPKNCH
ncbi:putative lipid-transfer protein DIR1 [Musa acuminata AAA Group]|uniref:(wild Malaysian banana) hypothetical protein n=1 Tax=Musa acuminata subsp. malaccensis TaxID=214687 RepID=A0A804JDY0_MUSAM|nr:PREDICTED: putative lipid-transfer protein DIR1 [Musa acuminata subsp. malaccensis]CAG1845636.1 unnamed protein product [Musa acuminata subsp. malaccensis]